MTTSLTSRIRRVVTVLRRPMKTDYWTIRFWERHYRTGGKSGEGSYGRLAEFKARVIKDILAEHEVESVVELGCGDGNQLAMIDYPRYVGLDVSPAAINRCRDRFSADPGKEFHVYVPGAKLGAAAEMAVSLDVIYHLIEDDLYDRYMRDLFGAATKLVVIYSSDEERSSQWPEVRHRRFSDWVAREAPGWRLAERIDQVYPYVAGEHETSWSDFFVYLRSGDSAAH
ncbi:MAG: hypothetical protein V3S60_11205 [Acidimicrobiia bacterium]